jgi:hypothetical protein
VLDIGKFENRDFAELPNFVSTVSKAQLLLNGRGFELEVSSPSRCDLHNERRAMRLMRVWSRSIGWRLKIAIDTGELREAEWSPEQAARR